MYLYPSSLGVAYCRKKQTCQNCDTSMGFDEIFAALSYAPHPLQFKDCCQLTNSSISPWPNTSAGRRYKSTSAVVTPVAGVTFNPNRIDVKGCKLHMYRHAPKKSPPQTIPNRVKSQKNSVKSKKNQQHLTPCHLFKLPGADDEGRGSASHCPTSTTLPTCPERRHRGWPPVPQRGGDSEDCGKTQKGNSPWV